MSMTRRSLTMIPVNEPLIGAREQEYVDDCLRTGWISSAGKYIERFETGWAQYCGRKHGVAVCNGTMALELALSVLDLPAGSEVILPSFTIASCLEAILRNELIPILVDSDPRTYCMDVEHMESRISSRTVAVMPVHIYGHPVDMNALTRLAVRHGLKIIEDAAEAHGSEIFWRGGDGGIKDEGGSWKRCGSFGVVSCFSFYANKNITCGEGGMVLTDDENLARWLKARRNLCFGKKERFQHEDRGWNFRMTNVQAAIGCGQLEGIAGFLERKRTMARLYDEGLRGLPLQLPHIEPWAKSSVWMYAVVLDDRVSYDAAEFARRLSAEGIQTRPFFLGMHEQPVYQQMGFFKNERYPVAERIARRGLYLPSGQAITDEQIRQVLAVMRSVLVG